MAAYERVTLNRGGRNSRFDCNTNDPQKKYCLGAVTKYVLLEGYN